MCAYHGDGVAGLPFGADGEGHDGGGVTGEVVLSAGSEGGGPGVSFLEEGGRGLDDCSFI